MNNDQIDSLRKYLGTLPARTNSDDWLEPEFARGISEMRINPVSPLPGPDTVTAIYKALFSMAVATWGEANIQGNWEGKWENSSPAARYAVVWNVLHFQTLPTAMESTNFTFEVSGGPRHFFDQVARTRIGAGFASIGCRDNSKLPAEFVLYSQLYDTMMDPQTPEEEKASTDLKAAFAAIKKAYQSVLDCGSGSYQTARAILPMSYHHQFTVTQNILSLIGAFGRRSCLGEEEFIVAYVYIIRKMLADTYGLSMLGDILRPTCHRTKKCHYIGTMAGGGTPGLFSNLFAPKDPECRAFVPKDFPDYAEFNQSCSDSAELIASNVGYMKSDEYPDYSADYDKAKEHLHPWELAAFEGAEID